MDRPDEPSLPDLPPEDAYGRVTDPGRYAPLHPAGRARLDRLERDHAVTREEWTEPGSGDAVRLTPADPAAAPLTVVFTTFPGLLVRIGPTRTGGLPLPHCGCDACAEQLPDLVAELDRLAAAVTAGSLGERLVPAGGDWWHEVWFRTPEASWSSRTLVPGAELAARRREIPGGELTWQPWPDRT
jgi:hypothetical protein